MRESSKNASDYRVIRNVTIFGGAVDAILAVIILHAAFKIGRAAFDELIDTGLDENTLASEGHHIGDRVMQLLRREFKSLADIVMHIDPEDDFDKPNPASLPLRPDLERAVRQTLASADAGSRSLEVDCLGLVLHYVGGVVTGEVIRAFPPEASRHLMESESAALSKALIEKTPLSAANVVYRSRSGSRFSLCRAINLGN